MVGGREGTCLVGSLGARLPEGRVLSKEELAGFPVRWFLVMGVVNVYASWAGVDDVYLGLQKVPKALEEVWRR